VKATDLVERFWKKVSRCVHGDPCLLCCWEWQGATVRGYGAFFVPKAQRRGRSRTERANRVCWHLLNGDIPTGFHVLHHCDNPLCVNPAHLWLGTIAANQKDSMRKGRRPTGDAHGLRKHPEAVRHGEKNAFAKLTAADVYAIRALIAAGHGNAQIARMFPVTASNIGHIRCHTTWRHLPEKEQS
jgi:hypothetical protein